MNGRLLLLVVATGAFMATWNTGSGPGVPEIRHAARPYKVSGRQVALERLRLQAHATAAPHTAGVDDFAMIDDCPVRLPAAITAGRYHVVSSNGHAGTVDVSRATAITGHRSAAGPVTEELDLYIEIAGAVRWYFIRQNAGPVVLKAGAQL